MPGQTTTLTADQTWREFTDRDALQNLIATGLAADLSNDPISDPAAW